MGDRHLVTVPHGVVGDRLPWGGERQGGGGYSCAPPLQTKVKQITLVLPQRLRYSTNLQQVSGRGRDLLRGTGHAMVHLTVHS